MTATSRVTAHNLILLGGAALRAGRFDEAIRHYEQATLIEPNNATAHAGLGCSYAYGGLRHQAEMPLRRSLRLDPECNSALRGLAWLLVGEGHHSQALPILKRYAAVAGDKFEAHFNLGIACRRLGNASEAAAALARAVEINPDHTVALEHLGLALKEAGHFERAASALRRAVTLLPCRADLCCELGDCYNLLEKTALAIAAYEMAVRTDPGLARAHHGLGTARYDDGAYPAAIAAFKAAARRAPDVIDHWCDWGTAHLAAGEYGLAAEVFAVACEQQPRHQVARRGIAAAHLSLGRRDSAYQHLMASWRDGANDPLTGYYLGLVHFREGRLRDAVSVCRRAIEANPGLCKAVSCHESSDGTATMTRAARRVSAELGAENLKDLRVILARAAGDAQWWPAHLSAVRAS